RERGVELTKTGERLHVSAPAGAITPEIRALLADHKTQIIAALGGPSPATFIPYRFQPYWAAFAVDADGYPIVLCFRCERRAWRRSSPARDEWLCGWCATD